MVHPVEVQLCSFFNVGDSLEWVVKATSPNALSPGKEYSTLCTESWLDTSAGLDGGGKPLPTTIRSLECPVRSESLYQLSYHGSCLYTGLFIIPSGISELHCATTKTHTAERSISIGKESLKVFFFKRRRCVSAGYTARG
jgi:hypothetical protein